MLTKAEAKRQEVEANRRAAYDKKVRTLVGLVASRKLTAQAVLAAYSANKTAEAFAAEVAALEPVGAAIYPLKADAVKAAGEHAQQIVDRVAKELEAAGGVLPEYPSRRTMSEHEYNRAESKYRLWSALTSWDAATYRPNEVKTGHMNPKGVQRFIDNAQDMAAAQYDEFVCKLVRKIGDDAVAATLEGSHVWSYSILHVTMADGSVQNWKTQQITNFTKYGDAYPQWPSRPVK